MVYRIAQVGGIVPLAGSRNEGRMRDGVATAGIDLTDAENKEFLAVQKLLFNLD